MADILFEDIFEVKDIDSGGKKFLRGKLLFEYDQEKHDLCFSFANFLWVRIV